MTFNFESQQGVGLYKLQGNLIGENDGIAITDSFAEKLDEGTHNFVINLEELQHINSSGLGVLITLLTKARKAGGDLVLANPSDFIKNLLLITKLNTIFRIFPSSEEAVSSFE